MTQKHYEQTNGANTESELSFSRLQQEFAETMQDPQFSFVRTTADTLLNAGLLMTHLGMLPSIDLIDGLPAETIGDAPESAGTPSVRPEIDTRFSSGAPPLRGLMFRWMDRNNDEALSADEVSEAIRTSGADRDGDGHISKMEDREWGRTREPRSTLRALEQLNSQFETIAETGDDDSTTVSRDDIVAFFAQRRAE